MKKANTLSPKEWITLGIFVFAIGGFLFVEIATTINPNFFVHDKHDNAAEIADSVRKNNPPETELPNTLLLDSYELQQSSYYSSEHPSLEEPDHFERIVVGKLTNRGDVIPAWSLHLRFDIYDLDGEKVNGAHCIVWNDADIEPGSTWNFKAFDNIDDCFPGISHSIKIDISKYVVVYKGYDIEK